VPLRVHRHARDLAEIRAGGDFQQVDVGVESDFRDRLLGRSDRRGGGEERADNRCGFHRTNLPISTGGGQNAN
jgi:hypothetical protein